MQLGSIHRLNYLVESEIFLINTRTILTLENTATAAIFTGHRNPVISISEYGFLINYLFV